MGGQPCNKFNCKYVVDLSCFGLDSKLKTCFKLDSFVYEQAWRLKKATS